MFAMKLAAFLLLLFINEITSEGYTHDKVQTTKLKNDQDMAFDQVFLDMYKIYMDRVKEYESKPQTVVSKKPTGFIKTLTGKIKKTSNTVQEGAVKTKDLSKKEKLRPFQERTLKLRDNIHKTRQQESVKKLSFSGAARVAGHGHGINPSISYFQSPEYVNNPLRKNNALREKRFELLHDPNFMREHGRLGQFLMVKGLQNGLFDSVSPKKYGSKSKQSYGSKQTKKNQSANDERNKQKKYKQQQQQQAEEEMEEEDYYEDEIIDEPKHVGKQQLNDKRKFGKQHNSYNEEKSNEKNQMQSKQITEKTQTEIKSEAAATATVKQQPEKVKKLSEIKAQDMINTTVDAGVTNTKNIA